MTMMPPPPTEQPERQRQTQRPCPHCAYPLTAQPCENCGWEPGLVPVAVTETPQGTLTSFAAEKRHRVKLTLGVLSCVLGVMLLMGGIAGGAPFNAAEGVIMGLVALAAGITTLKVTRAGRVWWGLSGRDKLLAAPGLVFGGFLALSVIPAVLMVWLMFAIMPRPGRDF